MSAPHCSAESSASFLDAFLSEVPAVVDVSHFSALADVLLQQMELIIAGVPHRLLEIEFYYHGREHRDPFAHCDPLQKTSGRWYFHRDQGTYRGGSFKGLDISFGPPDVFGGILLRSLEQPDGTVINGCSLLVDSLLNTTRCTYIADLDQQIDQRSVWDETSPLFLRQNLSLNPKDMYKTARVGLTLKRVRQFPDMDMYVMKPYRFLLDPAIKKGKVYTILSMLQDGRDLVEMQRLTQSPLRIIQQYQQAWESGKSLNSLSGFYGQSLSSTALCELHGAWLQRFSA